MPVATLISRLLSLALFLALPKAVWASGEVEFVTEELPWAAVDRPYSPPPLEVRVTGRCPAGGVGFAIVSGKLPRGLTLSRLGYFSGVPAQTGQFEFNVRAVSGCSWAARHFALQVAEPPKLKVQPGRLSVATPREQDPPPMVIRLTATWPRLAYQVNVSYGEGTSNWLTAVPEHGVTARESTPIHLGETPGDGIDLFFNLKGLSPGTYNARVAVSAWQTDSVVVEVTLSVDATPTQSVQPP